MTDNENYNLCYLPDEWKAYQEGILRESETLQMEKHLLVCDKCLETYLGIIEEHAMSHTKLSEDFTEKVLVLCGKASKRQNVNQTRNGRVNLFISYCAAAGIAMFFWVGGYFESLAGVINKEAQQLYVSKVIEFKAEPQKSLIQAGWTKNVAKEKHPSLIESFIFRKE